MKNRKINLEDVYLEESDEYSKLLELDSNNILTLLNDLKNNLNGFEKLKDEEDYKNNPEHIKKILKIILTLIYFLEFKKLKKILLEK